MAYLIGTDEAGYGPNLGPLTITASRWKTPAVDTCLYTELAEVFSNNRTANRLILADSKVAYRSGGTIKALETTVLATLALAHGKLARNWQELLLLSCGKHSLQTAVQSEWLADANLELPVKADENEIRDWVEKLRSVFAQKNVTLQTVKSAHLVPTEFNAGLSVHGNKASLLTYNTMRLVRQVWPSQHAAPLPSDPQPLRLICDKHGGRSNYLSTLNDHLHPERISICEEGRERSEYQWAEDSQPVTAQFISKGERELPVALASMVSKYLREITMILWNRFWQERIPGIKPTKGYPLDAKRFMREIEAKRDSLRMSKESIWRIR